MDPARDEARRSDVPRTLEIGGKEDCPLAGTPPAAICMDESESVIALGPPDAVLSRRKRPITDLACLGLPIPPIYLRHVKNAS